MEQLGWMLVEVKHGEKEMFVLEAEDGRRLCCGEAQMVHPHLVRGHSISAARQPNNSAILA